MESPQPVARHALPADVSFDGGALSCGNGLLLLIRKHLDPLGPGGILEIRSTEISVDEDLPAWCRLTGNELISWTRDGDQRSFLVSKGPLAGRARRATAAGIPFANSAPVAVQIPSALPPPAPAPDVGPLSVMGIGSWPRPGWMLRAIHDHVEGRLSDGEFEAAAQDAVQLSIDAQLRAGVDVVTDGEQRRDNYSSFVGGLLDNCVLVPLTDLLPLVDDPVHFQEQMKSLDVPAEKVRHPAIFGPLGRRRPLAVHEVEFAKTLTTLPVKVALPGPYLLTRTMWMECLTPHAYASRQQLSDDIVRVLREELHFLLAAGASIVQFDEPVLTEVVFSGPKNTRSFMCGALSERESPDIELSFARDLINRVVEGVPRSRTALHVCRGNWSPDESVALSGDYRPLLELFNEVAVGTLFLELCTPRAGDIEVLRGLTGDARVGVGVVNQKSRVVERVSDIVDRARVAIHILGVDRVLLTPDCGFATFADNPVAAPAIARQKLAAVVQAAGILRREHRVGA
jgi:5-methyltetrahydropteroyltriglutamate--homocysteine methyltransferase